MIYLTDAVAQAIHQHRAAINIRLFYNFRNGTDDFREFQRIKTLQKMEEKTKVQMNK